MLGEIGSGTLSHDLTRTWNKIRKKNDSIFDIDEENDRTVKSSNKYVWSLKDINFEIKQGDAVGIIGRNGAGKSTLLKLLSKVTKPTTGSFKVNGRISSLLEIGTGFNPEMTGLENIYLNGAILGMRKNEIKKNIDEIIDFSGIERYINTPLKRYSSGMYIRLAFAVAAHLESEILIFDEVLAVGDVEFQKKCLGKMKDISLGQHRTILFVSHNISSIKQLCNTGILLENGRLKKSGNIDEVISSYTNSVVSSNSDIYFNLSTKRSGNKLFQFKSIKILDQENRCRNEFSMGESLIFNFEIFSKLIVNSLDISFQIRSSDGMPIHHIVQRDSIFSYIFKKETESFFLKIDDIRLYPGIYTVTIALHDASGHEEYDCIVDAINFTITDGGIYTSRQLPRAAGLIYLNPEWGILSNI
jgi:ABC-type polysaccharide/polyol phosphate transport system ATPase subunit